MLNDLSHNFLQVKLIPAPDPQFTGHKVRFVENENPIWYKKIFDSIGYINRDTIKKTLQRIINNDSKYINVYHPELMQAIRERIAEYEFYEKENQKNQESQEKPENSDTGNIDYF